MMDVFLINNISTAMFFVCKNNLMKAATSWPKQCWSRKFPSCVVDERGSVKYIEVMHFWTNTFCVFSDAESAKKEDNNWKGGNDKKMVFACLSDVMHIEQIPFWSDRTAAELKLLSFLAFARSSIITLWGHLSISINNDLGTADRACCSSSAIAGLISAGQTVGFALHWWLALHRGCTCDLGT